jgi:hypothetical protein
VPGTPIIIGQKQVVVSTGYRGEGRELLFNGHRVLALKEEKC